MGNKGKKKSHDILSFVSLNSSLHGLVWYNRTEDPCLKISLVILSALALLALPTLVVKFINFYGENHEII